ncbi:hypothetical protein [Streptomyces sp. NPDC057557]|uniref:hypothetical protein n=1 Tax=Streptomyces sp. NPDC057557 TaxID=3346167 RepID=UPI00367E2C2D
MGDVEVVVAREGRPTRVAALPLGRGQLVLEQAALKRLYLSTLALDPTERGRQRWNNKWKKALNEFDLLFDGRLTAGRV